MAKHYSTNVDRILKSVLDDDELTKFGNYSTVEYSDIETALASDNSVVATVAKIIKGKADARSDKEIYMEISNYLKTHL